MTFSRQDEFVPCHFIISRYRFIPFVFLRASELAPRRLPKSGPRNSNTASICEIFKIENDIRQKRTDDPIPAAEIGQQQSPSRGEVPLAEA